MSQETSTTTNTPTGNMASRLRTDLLQAAEQIGQIQQALQCHQQIEESLSASRTVLQDTQHLNESLLWAENSVAQLEAAQAELRSELEATHNKAVKSQAALTEANAALTTELKQSQSEHAQLKTQYHQLLTSAESTNQELSEAREAHNRLRRESSETEKRLRSAIEQMETALSTEHEGRAISEKELDAARLRVSHLQTRLEQAESSTIEDRERYREQNETLKTQIDDLQSKLQIVATQTQQDAQAAAAYDALELERDEFRLQVVALQKQLETARSNSTPAATEETNRQIRELHLQVKQLQAELGETSTQLDRSQIALAELKRNQPSADPNESAYVEALMQDAKSICEAAKAREEIAHADAAKWKAEAERLTQELSLARQAQTAISQASDSSDGVRRDAAAKPQPSILPQDFRQREKRRKIYGA